MAMDSSTSVFKTCAYRALPSSCRAPLELLRSKSESKGCLYRTVKTNNFRRILICITDEEWDIKALKNDRGQKTSREEVCKMMHQAGYEPFAVVVRPNHFGEQNNDFIEVSIVMFFRL